MLNNVLANAGAHSITRDPPFGDAGLGDYNYEIISSANAADNFVAIYYRLIRQAVVLTCLDGVPNTAIVTDLDPATAHELLSEKFGVDVWRVRITQKGSTYGINADPPTSKARGHVAET